MDIYYESMTGNVRRLIARVQARVQVRAHDLRFESPHAPYLLFTYTFGRGEVPGQTARFLESHAGLLRGVVVSGSYHWGETFGRAGDHISAQYGVPLVARVNKSGSDADAETVAAWLRERRPEAGALFPLFAPPDTGGGWPGGEWLYVRPPVSQPRLFSGPSFEPLYPSPPPGKRSSPR